MPSQKLPALQFYPGDWRKDVGVQSLSYHDRGVWHELLMLMHESEERGVMVLNGSPMSDEAIGRLLGLDNQTLTTTLTTLLTTGVASRQPGTGALMCRRMVRDEQIRQIRKDAGKLGGNPALLNQKPTTKVKQKPTPSVSSSVSSSKQNPPSPLVVPEPNQNPVTLTAEEAFEDQKISGAIQLDHGITGNYLPRDITAAVRNIRLTEGLPHDAIREVFNQRWSAYLRSGGKCGIKSWIEQGMYMAPATKPLAPIAPGNEFGADMLARRAGK